jgi:hypothetical protein
MSTKNYGDGAVHSYFNPYSSPYDAFVLYNNILSDLKLTLESCSKTATLSEERKDSSSLATNKPKAKRTSSKEMTL